MLNFFHIPIKLISRQAANWSLIPRPFQRKVYLSLHSAGGIGLFPLLITPDKSH